MERIGLGRIPLALLVLLVPVTIVVFGFVAPAAVGQPAEAVTETDQQLLVKVRQAGLWEMPAGQQAQQQAASQVVKDVGATIAEQHELLDEQVLAVAAQLGVELPDQPSEEQKLWLAELSTKWGPEFDTAYANLLRAAHGKVFAVIAQVRAGTRNQVVRDFAETANEAVKTHMTLLESTGQVDFSSLPEPEIVNSPATAAHTQHGIVEASSQTSTGGIDVGLVIAICLVEFGVVLGLLRIVRRS